jgi:ribosomal protein S18 acetylase RimI-like enzyme
VRLTALAVLPEYRRQGIAKELVKAVVAALTVKRYSQEPSTDGTLVNVYLRTSNLAARKFYGGLGEFSEGGYIHNMFRTLGPRDSDAVQLVGRV